MKITRALLSVSDKTGLAEFGKFLSSQGVEMLSTGGTAQCLRDAGLAVIDVSEVTGFPEILNGRVKTLHPKVHGALLAVRGNEQHEKELKEHEIRTIDMVVTSLYPFEQTVAKGADFDTCIENIDIGGPCMVRSSAKNHKYITIVTSIDQYERVQKEMQTTQGCTTLKLRRKLACEAFQKTCAYESAIIAWFSSQDL